MERVGTAATLLAIVLALHGQQSKPTHADENDGVIQGTVTYEDGRPVKDATVYAQPLDRAMMGIVPHATTDESGHFVISHLWLGKYAVGGEKLDEGYANMTNQFYSDGKFETVVLTSRKPAAGVIIQLGPKAGILVGTVVDAVTNAPLNPCVEFRRGTGFSNFLSGTGLVNAKYRVLVPSSTDVLMKVWYGGHKSWYYPGTKVKAQSRPLNLKPGEVTKIDIRLEPDPDAPPSGCGMPVGTVVNP
jgi:hypothetical protein